MKDFGTIIDIETNNRPNLLTKYKLHWVIPNVRSSSSSVGSYDESPHFFLGENKEYEWSLDIFLSGYKEDMNGYVSIRVYLHEPLKHKNANFVAKFSILDKYHRNYITKLIEVQHGEGTIFRFISRKILLSKAELLPNDKLRIACEILNLSTENIKSDENMFQITPFEDNPLKNFQKLLDNDKFSDFKLVVGEQEFKVHRAILAVQSPVFKAMFDSNMRETSEGKTQIDDIEPKVMEKLLHFIYTGKIDIQDSADKLLVAAEKYEVESLKLRCENDLAKGLNVDNVYNVLLLADHNNATNLKEKAISFFNMNLNKLINSGNFEASADSLPKNLLISIIRAGAR